MALSIREYLEQRPGTSKEIQAATGLNQKAVSRQLKSMGNSVIKLKYGRSFKYMITRNAFGSNDRIPLFIVNTHGSTELTALIRPLAQGGFYVEEQAGMPQLLLGEAGNGLFDDLPYFLSDLAPHGFIGRQIAKVLSAQSDEFPSDPRFWNANHIGCYLMSNGDDLPGNIQLGVQSGLRMRRKPVNTPRDSYPALADSVISGELGGSSAGGEQPKFTAFCAERASHVIVKFSPDEATENARRWRDILITEHYATKIMHALKLPAPETELFEKGGRLFLESVRFDRTGEHGRTSMTSLQSVDAEFVGSGGSWPQVLDSLFRQKLIDDFSYSDGINGWAFGRLISNTDMHLGNLSLSIEGNTFSVCPIYDMCSMAFAPKTNGEISPFVYSLPDIRVTKLSENQLVKVTSAARDFWKYVANEERTSDEFRKFIRSDDGPLNALDSDR